MIIEGLLSLVQLLLLGLTLLLPSYSPPTSVDLSAFQVVAWLIPLQEIVTLASVFVAAVVASLTYTLANTIFNKVRGSG